MFDVELNICIIFACALQQCSQKSKLASTAASDPTVPAAAAAGVQEHDEDSNLGRVDGRGRGDEGSWQSPFFAERHTSCGICVLQA